MKRRAVLAGFSGIAMAITLRAGAQKSALPTIGFLSTASPGPWSQLVAAFRVGLAEAGYTDGKNVAIDRAKAGALLVGTDSNFDIRREKLIALSTRYRLPTLYFHREFVAAGGLASYGTDIADAYRQAGVYTGKILKGAKPADLPVLQPNKIELVINRRTAKTLGLTIPQSLLLREDEVIQ